MKEQTEWVEYDAMRKKVVFWMMVGAGIIAIIIGIVSIAILVIGGLMLMITAIGSLFVGRYLLVQAKEWRHRHMIAIPPR